MSVSKIKLLVVAGPTAVGKTALGIQLAQQFNGEIISGDSQQVYRHLNIGTAKATPEEQAAARHHLIDIKDADESYSAYDFVKDASQAIQDIHSRGKLPIIVGGTGLYLQSLLEGYHLGGELDQEQVLAFRKHIEVLSDQELLTMAADRHLMIKESNRRRLIRALELSEFSSEFSNQEPPYDAYLIGLNDDRQLIYNRINTRVDDMIANGLIEEAKWLYNHYPKAQSSRGIGYKELFPYFAGQESLEVAIDRLKQNTRRFAKRQLTWFRNRMSVHFYPISDQDYPKQIIEDVRKFFKESK